MKPRGQRAKPPILPLASQLQDQRSGTTTAGRAPCQRSQLRRRILSSTQRSYKGGCRPNHDCIESVYQTQLLNPMFGTIRSAYSPKGKLVRCLLIKSGAFFARYGSNNGKKFRSTEAKHQSGPKGSVHK